MNILVQESVFYMGAALLTVVTSTPTHFIKYYVSEPTSPWLNH